MNKTIFSKRNIALFILAMFFVGDRFLKYIAVNNLWEMPRQLLGPWLGFNFSANYRIAFSLPLEGWGLIFAIGLVILLVIFYLFYLILAKNSPKQDILPLTFLIFGAISNLTDRLYYGYVIDYLDGRYFTVFNLADVLITISAAWILINLFKKNPPQKYERI